MAYTTLKPFIFAVFFLASMAMFGNSVWRMARLARLGDDKEGLFDGIGERLGGVIYLAFFQRKVVQEKFGWNHVVIFWSFMIITVGHAEFMLRGIFPFVSLDFLGPVYSAILIGGDVMAFVVLFAVASALFRRVVLKPSYLHLTAEGPIILGLITSVMLTYFLATGFAVAGVHADVAGHEASLPVSSVVAGWFSGVAPETARTVWYEVFWWSHAVVLMTFLNVIPKSKHIHLLGAIPNIFVQKKDKPRSALTTMDFETEDAVWGVSKVNQFTWKALLDTYACTECGRCDKYCPARRTGKPLEPQQLMHDIRGNLYENGDKVLADRKFFDFLKAPADWEPELALVAASEEERQKGKQTSSEVLWACTSCGACVNACPVMIDHVDAIMDMRRYQTLMEGNVSTELTNTFQNIERNYNPWGIGADKRADWAEGLGLKFWGGSEDKEKFEYLFWVGCAGSYDLRAQKTMKAFAEILDTAGISYAILGQTEKCSGDSLRRTGNEYAFDALAKENVETLNELGVKKVVTACPHCFNTLKNEYPAFGGHYEVQHHTQMISDLIGSGRIELTEEVNKKVTFHDPCFLGRWNDETEAPRKSLAAIKHLSVVEMEESGKKSFCCGAGGGQMWMEEMEGTKRINLERTEHALATGADTIAVGCPFCMTMLEDGVKSKEAEEKVQVKDVAELVAMAMKKKPKPAAEEAPGSEDASA